MVVKAETIPGDADPRSLVEAWRPDVDAAPSILSRLRSLDACTLSDALDR